MYQSKHLWRGLFFILLITALCGGLALPVISAPARAAPNYANAMDVVINEVAWAGTAADANDEWIELYNPTSLSISLTGWQLTDNGDINISLSGSIPAGGYFLLERGADNNTISDIIADQTYSGAMANGGEALYLYDSSTPSNLIDSVNSDGGAWPAGTAGGGSPAFGSMERISYLMADSDTNWLTNNGTVRNGLDANSNPINGTPKQINSATPATLAGTATESSNLTSVASTLTANAPENLTGTAVGLTNTAAVVNATGTAAFDQTATALASATVTTITADTPDPSLVNQDVTVAVTVTGSTLPTGTVAITGADVNCTITLANGSGSCIVRFTSAGAKTITATYSGDSSHTPSSDTETHQVTTPATATNTPSTGSANSVVISEFRTRGPAGADDEFVEIYNPTTSPVDISGWIISASNSAGTVQNRATIPASILLRSGQYYLIAHNNYVVPSGGLTPNLRYGTSISNDGGVALLNSAGEIIDEVGMHENSFYQEGNHLPPFSGTSNGSYERKNGDALDSCVDDDDNSTDFRNAASGTLHNYSSPLSLCGSTRPAPSTTTTLITADTPDPSTINGNVSVSVRVTGGSTTPSGKVNITGANTNCSITLNASGTGSCIVKFTTNGSKTITATYLGDNTHTSSSDTEPHQVGTTTANPTPTRQPTPLPPPPLIGINEFVPRPGHDWNNDGVINTGDEYIELINHGVIDVDLSGYSLDDEVNIGSAPFRLPSIILKPGERRVFYGSETGLLLSDGGDGVRLLNPNGQLGDAYNYRVVRFPDQSYCRLPDNGGLDDWNQNCFPTPGLQNSLSGSTVNPPTSGDAENLCPIADTLPADFVFAECSPFGNNIWNAAYWDRNGWYGEKNLPQSPGKWNVFVD